VTLVLFILIFGIVVLAHEFGHFILARMNGIHVVEFSIGMGPTLFHVDKGDTRYAIKLLPIGGACMFEGEDGLNLKQEKEETSEMDDTSSQGSFIDAGPWARFATVLAGPLFNVILGFFIALIVVAYNGIDLPVVQQIMEDSAAQDAGMEAGDVITKINGDNIRFYREISLESSLNTTGEEMEITFQRDGKEQTVQITPRYNQQDNRYYIGLVGAGEYVKISGLDVLKYGGYETAFVLENTIKSLKLLVTGHLSKDDISGPVGIASYVGETYEEVKDYGVPAVVLTMLDFILILSINLGVMNLLPLPALDGGRLIFILLELIRGKPIPPEKEGMVHFAGLILFFIFTIFILYNDILKIIR